MLVGHSYAGLVVREAADARPRAVDHVVLLDGWAGPDGASLFSLAPDPFVTAVRTAAEAHGDGRLVPAPPRQRSASSTPTTRPGWHRACSPSRCGPSPSPHA